MAVLSSLRPCTSLPAQASIGLGHSGASTASPLLLDLKLIDENLVLTVYYGNRRYNSTEYSVESIIRMREIEA